MYSLGYAPSYYSVGQIADSALNAKSEVEKADDMLKTAGKLRAGRVGAFEAAASMFRNIESAGMTDLYMNGQKPAFPIANYKHLTIRLKGIIAQELSEIDFDDPNDIADVKKDILEDWHVSEKLTQQIISGTVDGNQNLVYYAIGGGAIALSLIGYYLMK